MSNTITLCYGPIDIEGVVQYRPLRLKRVMYLLANLAFNVTTERIQPRDRLIVKLDGITVFTCRFTYLKFKYQNNEYYIIHKIIWAALEARERLKLGHQEKETLSSTCSIPIPRK